MVNMPKPKEEKEKFTKWEIFGVTIFVLYMIGLVCGPADPVRNAERIKQKQYNEQRANQERESFKRAMREVKYQESLNK